MTTPTRTILITGANTGIGKDLARQLALTDRYARIHLAARNTAKTQAAAADLRQATGRDIFTAVSMDLTDPASVRTATATLTAPLDDIVMNAGGFGGPTPRALTADGVTQIFAQNVLGHALLLTTLIEQHALTGTGILTGSEAARGVPKMAFPRPKFPDHSVQEFTAVADGSYFNDHRFNTTLAYGQVKYIGALWMAALARRHPDLRLLTVSPGNTAGTEAARDLNPVLRGFMTRVFYPVVAPRLGLAHSLQTGAARLARGLTDTTLTDGAFYASAKNGVVGPIADQALIDPTFADPTIQDAAHQTIRQLLERTTTTRHH